MKKKNVMRKRQSGYSEGAGSAKKKMKKVKKMKATAPRQIGDEGSAVAGPHGGDEDTGEDEEPLTLNRHSSCQNSEMILLYYFYVHLRHALAKS